MSLKRKLGITIIAILLISCMTSIYIPHVQANTYPFVSKITRYETTNAELIDDNGDGIPETNTAGNPSGEYVFCPAGYDYFGSGGRTQFDPVTGMLGPVKIDLPNAGGSPTPPPTHYLTMKYKYEIEVKCGSYTPKLVGGFADHLESWTYSSSTNILTIVGWSNLKPNIAALGGTNVYVLAFMVMFGDNFDLMRGMLVTFNADDFDMQPGSTAGGLEVRVSNDPITCSPPRSSGQVKIFIPKSLTDHFGRSLDDVVITVDGAGVTATTIDVDAASSPVTIDGAGFAGRWFVFTVTFSDRTIETDPNPGAVGGYLAPVNKLTILLPYLTLVGMIGVASTVFVIRRRRKV